MELYVVTVRNEYLRDTQIWAAEQPHYGDESEIEEEVSWMDFYPTHYVGIFMAKSKEDALTSARKWDTTLEDIIDDGFDVVPVSDEIHGIERDKQKEMLDSYLRYKEDEKLFLAIKNRENEKYYLNVFVQGETEYDGFDLYDGEMKNALAYGEAGTYGYLKNVVIRELNESFPELNATLKLKGGILIYSDSSSGFPQYYTFEEFIRYLRTVNHGIYNFELCYYIYNRYTEDI